MTTDDSGPRWTRTTIHTDDAERAVADISKVFSPHRMDVVGSPDSLLVDVDAYVSERLSVVRISHGAEVVVSPGELSSYYEINIPITGRTESTCGDDAIVSTPTVGAVLTPNRQSRMRWSADCRQLAVKVSRDLIDTTVERLTGTIPDELVDFTLAFDVSTPAGRAWIATVDLLADSIAQEAPDFVIRPLEEIVVGRLLVTAPNSFAARIAGDPRPPRPRIVRRATDAVDTDPGAPHSASSLAAVAGVSVRTLQAAFAEHLGTAPMEYVRRVRLSRCRSALLESPAGDRRTIAEIAFSNGFTHLPRFAAAYRRQYGENPSDTLRR